MPYQLRNRTRVTNVELTTSSTASSSTLKSSCNSVLTREGSLTEHEADKPTLSGRSETKRPKRGFSESSEEGAGEFH
jgi:hypothetical protein